MQMFPLQHKAYKGFPSSHLIFGASALLVAWRDFKEQQMLNLQRTLQEDSIETSNSEFE